MPRRSEYSTTLGEGSKAQQVGYSAKRRGKFLAVVFVDPDGKRLEKMTPCKRLDNDFHIEVAKILVRVYTPCFPEARRVTWDEAMAEVEKTAPDLRTATLVAYKKAIKQLRATLGSEPRKPTGPADITPELATRFSRLFSSTSYTRGSSPTERKRSPVTLSYYLRSLSALWGQFRELGYTKANPWTDVRRPKLDKKKKYVPAEADIAEFMRWISEKYPVWERLEALLKVKLLSGCRTADIVQLRTEQLQNGELVFAADQVKNKEGRTVPLPPELFDAIKRLAGRSVNLWDGWNEDVKRFRPGANKLPTKFQPSTVYCVLCNIFREYSDAHPARPRLTPHAFRRRAITLMTVATQSVDLTAQALGVSAQTARTYYLDAQRVFNTKDAFRLATGLLLPSANGPQNAPTIPPLSGSNGVQSGTDQNNGKPPKA